MGVSILEGGKAERIATALETIASQQNAAEEAQAAAEAAQAAASEASIAAAAANETINSIQGLSEDIATLETLLDGVRATPLGAVSFKEDQTVPEYEEDGETIKTPAITAAQQAIARANIGLNDIDALTTGNVKYNSDQSETLSPEQKGVARNNIGAMSSAEVSTAISNALDGVVRYDAAQDIDPEDQDVARDNIGAASAADVESLSDAINDLEDALDNVDVGGVVRYDEDQSEALAPEEKETARDNIGAASAADLSTTSGNLATVTGIVNGIQTNINNGGIVTSVEMGNEGLTVTYSNNEQDIVELSAGVAGVEYDQNYYLHFYDAGGQEMFNGPFFIQGGGGGGGYSARISNGLSSTTLTVAANQTVVLPFTYTEYYGEENTYENGYLTVQYKRSTDSDSAWTTIISRQQIPSGQSQRVDISSLLEEGTTTNVRVICTNGRQDEDAITKTLQYNVICVAMSIATTFNSESTYTGNLSIPYTCVGRNLEKTVYLYIDGREYTHLSVGTSHNQSLQMPVTMTGYNYGAHRAQMWFETPDGASSNVLSFVILYDNGTSQAPIIGARLVDDDIENGEQLDIRYTCYTPGQEKTDALTIRVYSVLDTEEYTHYTNTFVNINNNEEQQLVLTQYPDIGTGYIEFTSGSTHEYLQFTVREVQTDYDILPVTTGLVYSYKPVGFTNNASDRDEYIYEMVDETGADRNIYSTMDDFNWVTDGYLDGESLTLNGSARMHINLPLLTTAFTNDDNQRVVLDAASGATVTTSGRTAEFEFELSNVTDQNAPVISCIDEHGVGFVVTPQVCYLCSDGQAPDFDATGFIQNEENLPCAYIKDEKRIRVSFVIQRKKTEGGRFVSYANIFINGEYANSYLYSEDAIYNSAATVTIGSDYCTTKIYDIRMYNRDLDKAGILQNRMNSSADIRVRIAQNEYNDVLDSENNIDYNKAKYKYPCLLFIGPLSNFKADKKNVGVVLTKPDGRGGYTTEFSLLDKDQDGKFVSQIYVQGTSSQRFMRKNFKVKLTACKYDEHGDLVLDENNKAETQKIKYVLKGYDEGNHPLSIGESTLCFKMDYMSTDHANTFNANIADTLFNDKPAGSLVQNTVWGFRCLLFNMPLANYVEGIAFEDYPEGSIEFAGDGCLNNDKGNTKSFGLESQGDSGNDTLQQKWEFKDNSQAPCSFKTDRLMEKIYSEDENHNVTYTRAVKAALESCYPDEGDLEDEGLEPNYDHIQVLFSWVYQRANFWDASDVYGTGGMYNGQNYGSERALKKAIFIEEFPLHFNMEHALVYYLFIEWVALCDNRAKNMFLSCKDIRSENIVFKGGATSLADCINDETGEVDISKIDWERSTFGIWYTDLYDLDSCFGAENSGYIRIPYYADWNYQLKGNHQFNGHDSRLWCMFEEAFATQIKERAQNIVRTNTGYGALNYNVLKQVHITDNAELVCPAIVNEDMEYKYEDAWTKGYYDYSQDSDHPEWVQTNAYKYLQRGSRTEQKESFIYRRSNMLYSKYQCDPFINDQILFRCGDAVELGEDQTIELQDSLIELKAIQAMWMAVSYGDSGIPQVSTKKMAGETASFTANNRMGRSDHIHIHGASQLTDISSLAKFKPYEIGLTTAGKLKTLLLGSHEAGYENTNLTALDTTACVLLDTLNVENCNGFTDAINLRKNTLIREIYASGSTVPYFLLADGGILEKLELGSPTRILLQNQQYLTHLTYDSLDNLNALRVESTPNIHVLDIVRQKLGSLRNGLRLININETVIDRSIFTVLTSSAAKGKRMDANGNLVNDPEAYPVITGKIRCAAIGARQLADMNRLYPDLTIEADEELSQFTVSFVNPDGTTVKDRRGNDYVQYIDSGSSAYNPITADEIDPPTMEPTAQYTYTFSGTWSNLTGVVQADKTVTAVYTSNIRTYTVSWYLDENSSTPLKTAQVTYGSEAVYDSLDETNYPSRTDQESNYRYQVFAGWDKSTGYVTNDIRVNGMWDRATLPATRYMVPGDASSGENPNFVPLNEMSVAQIYAVTKSTDVNHYWENEDYTNIRVGRDFNFTNVTSALLADNLYCNKIDLTETDQSPFAVDQSFTLAIDYEFADTTTQSTLVACYDGEGAEGFRLYYNSSPMIAWGDKTASIGNAGMKRGIVILMHPAGSNNLLIVSNNMSATTYNLNLYQNEVARTQSTTTNAHIVLGGSGLDQNGNIQRGAKGMIHWCKIWYANLGLTAIKQLANWTHETWRMKFAGKDRYQITGSGYTTNGTFVASSSLESGYAMSPSGNHGWDETNLINFMNTRVFKALPVSWQQIIKPVNLPIVKFTSQYTPTTTTVNGTRVYIPALIEMSSSTNTSYSYPTEGITLPWSSTNRSRLFFAGLTIPDDCMFITGENEDPSMKTALYPNLKDGDIWINSSNSYGYIYVSPSNAEKHGYLGNRLKSHDYNIQANNGGVWVRTLPTWTRTQDYLNVSSPYYWCTTETGSMTRNYYSGVYGILPMFSI